MKREMNLQDILYQAYYKYYYSKLVDEFIPTLIGVFMNHGLSYEDSEDLCAETILGGWILIVKREFKNEAKMTTVLYTIARRRLIDYYRSKYRKRRNFEKLINISIDDLAVSDYKEKNLLEKWFEVEDKIKKNMTKQERLALTTFVNGLTVSEASEVLNVSKTVLQSHRSNAIRKASVMIYNDPHQINENMKDIGSVA